VDAADTLAPRFLRLSLEPVWSLVSTVSIVETYREPLVEGPNGASRETVDDTSKTARDPNEQRDRWLAGLDPRTGLERSTRSAE
jgi:hypothetical protein